MRQYKQSKGQQVPRAAHLIAREIDQAEQRLADIVDDEDADAALTILLSPLALQILVHLQRANQQRRGEIIDQLLRDCGSHFAAA